MFAPSTRLNCSVFTMCLVFGSAHIASAQIRQTSFPLYYDPANGNVTLDVSTIPTGRLGGYVVSLDPDGSSLDSDGNVVEEIPHDLDGFAIDNFTHSWERYSIKRSLRPLGKRGLKAMEFLPGCIH